MFGCAGAALRALFEPDDSLVRPRLHQMNEPDLAIPTPDPSIAGAEPDGLLLERDHVLYRPGEELTPGKSM
jgi:hypothetical protein